MQKKPQSSNPNQVRNNFNKFDKNRKYYRNTNYYYKKYPQDRYTYDDNYESNTKNNIEKVTPSTEPGFQGTPDKWFSDEEFFKGLPGTSDIDGKKDYYFNSYSSYHIHEQMLSDEVRTGSYQQAIMQNAEQFKDKVVLDIGCGTGILSIFAAKAGAKHVYGIEFADIADYAKKIIQDNNLSDKITIIKSKVEEADLPVKKVDIIISEWMGYFLIYESMLDTVLYARDKWLEKDGLILPDKASITLAAIEDTDYKNKKINFWSNVYGVDMSCFKKTVIAEPIIDTCPKKLVNSSHCKIFDIDLMTVKKEELDFSSAFEVTFWKNHSNFSGLVGWFDTEFSRLSKPVNLTTSPFRKSTHWSQTIFYCKSDLYVKRGDKVTGSIAVRKAKANFRQLDIKISYHVNNCEGFKDKEENNWEQLYKIA